MLPGKRLYILSLSLFVFAVLCTPLLAKKSVYVISDTGTYEYSIPIIQAYKIEGNNLVYQTNYNSAFPCAISLAIDTDTEYLFVTHEFINSQNPGNRIEIVNAKTMQYVDSVSAPGATNLAGIVFDRGKHKVYTVDRKTPRLYVYSWNPLIPRLTLDQQVELPGLIDASGDPYGVGGAWGLALDRNRDSNCDDLLLFIEDWLQTTSWCEIL